MYDKVSLATIACYIRRPLMLEKLSAAVPATAEEITEGLAAAKISLPESELTKLQDRQRLAVRREIARRESTSTLQSSRGKQREGHPDLQDLSFDPLGSSGKYE